MLTARNPLSTGPFLHSIHTNNCVRGGGSHVVQSGAYSAKFAYPFVPVQVKNVFFTLRCLHQHHLAKHMLLITLHFKMGDMKEVSYGCILLDDMNHAWFLSSGMKEHATLNETLTFAIFLQWEIARLATLSPPMATAHVETYQISTKIN